MTPLPPDSGRLLLTQSQIRSLLDLVLDPQASSGQGFDRRIDTQLALDEIGARLGVSTTGMLDRLAEERLSIPDLVAIKDVAARLLANQGTTPVQRDAAEILYHAAIAAALCRGGGQISSEPIHSRRETYLRLGALFSGDSLGDVFARAAAWTILIDGS